MRVLLACVLLASVALAGCGGSEPSPSGRFAGADHRFAGSPSAEFQLDERLVLPAGTHTLRIAAASPSGFGIELESPSGDRFGFTHSYHVDIGVLEYLIQDDVGGLWSLSYGCAAPCEYAIAIDEGERLPTTPAPGFQDVATAHAAGSIDGGSEQHTIDVPAGNYTIRTHFQSSSSTSWMVRDGAGAPVTFWEFEGIHARDWRYGPANPELTPGTWTVAIDCAAACSYNIGVIVA